MFGQFQRTVISSSLAKFLEIKDSWKLHKGELTHVTSVRWRKTSLIFSAQHKFKYKVRKHPNYSS